MIKFFFQQFGGVLSFFHGGNFFLQLPFSLSPLILFSSFIILFDFSFSIL